MTNVAGGKLPHQLEVALEHFCWSTYAASTKELSATAGLNFLAREDSPICVAAGGNSRIVERVLEKLLETIPASNFRPRSMAIDVRVEGDGVRVLYADIEGNLHHIKAKAVVMSCPKFVVKHIVHDLEPERVKAIESLRYRAYMTANVLVKDKLPETIYDVFLTGNGHDDHQRDYSNIKKAQAEQNATDFVIANFAAHGHDFGVMTFYRAFPFDGARQELIQPTSYETYKKKFEQQITDQILPLMKVKPSQVVDLRLTRWGHALPLSWKGVFKDGVPATLRKPFKNRVFFVEQDNWVYPATETGVTEAATWAPEIKKVLKGQA